MRREMRRWLVGCEHRTDGGLGVSTPTARRFVEVQATNKGDARLLAISAVYEELDGKCSHVRPLSVVEVGKP